MSRKLAKQLTAITMAGIMMLSMTGCGKGGNNGSGGKNEPKQDTKTMVYQGNEIVFDGVQGDIGDLIVKGDKIYFTTYEWIEGDAQAGDSEGEESDTSEEGMDEGDTSDGEEKESSGESTTEDETSEEETTEEKSKDETTEATTEENTEENTTEESADDTSEDEAVSDDTEGTSEEEQSEEEETYIDGTNITRMYVAGIDGSNATEISIPNLKEDEWIYYMAVNDANEIILLLSSYDEKTEKTNYIVRKMTEDGEELLTEDITKVLDLGQDKYLSKILFDNEGRLIAVLENSVLVLDKDYKKADEIKSESWLQGAALTKDGKIICGQDSGDSAQVIVLDVDNGKWGESIELELRYFSSSEALMDGNEDYDFYYRDDSGIYGFNMTDKKSTKLLDYVASDISSDHTYGMIPLSKDLMLGRVWGDNGTQLVQYTKVDPSEIADKKTITFGGQWISDEIKSAAIEFNKNSKEYRVEFKDYSNEEDPMTKMNADIVAGNIPDILYVDSAFIQQYVSKGILEDLTPYYDKDSELNTSDIIEPLYEAMKIDGKLYYISPDFGINSLLGSADVVGTESGWTFEEFKTLLEEKGDSVKPFYSDNKSMMLYTLLGNGIADFVDWQTGECRFNSQDFKDILEICNTGTNEEPDYENGPSMPSLVQEGKVLLTEGYVDLEELQMYSKMFGSKLTFIGYPNEKREGSYFTINTPIGISAKSEVKDAAWEFVRTFMTKEYQATKLRWSTPTRQDCLDMKIKAQMTTENYTDEFGQEISPVSSSYGYGNDWEVEIGPSSQEEVDLYLGLINNTKKVGGYDYKIMEIIEEETKAYFSGDKSLEDTADIIQNRITTYVNENR